MSLKRMDTVRTIEGDGDGPTVQELQNFLKFMPGSTQLEIIVTPDSWRIQGIYQAHRVRSLVELASEDEDEDDFS